MTRLLFQRTPSAYLPEIPAYLEYLSDSLPTVQAYDSCALGSDACYADFDVVWRFMGLDILPYKCAKNLFSVHEYGSASTGAFPKLKNRAKRILNRNPHQRIFLNKYVESQFSFVCSDIPHFYRDMGVSSMFFANLHSVPRHEYDFVFSGSLYRHEIILKTLHHMASESPKSRFLVIGEIKSDDAKSLMSKGNVECTGRVSYESVPNLLRLCRYGLNIMPNDYPFNKQTATKVLEYFAAGLPVVSTRYEWIEDFLTQRSGRCYWLVPEEFTAATLKMIDDAKLEAVAVEDLNWNNVIKDSGVFDFLEVK